MHTCEQFTLPSWLCENVCLYRVYTIRPTKKIVSFTSDILKAGAGGRIFYFSYIKSPRPKDHDADTLTPGRPQAQSIV